ncbi:MAG TPA: lamin tail domain-containing protein, partial [Verrucomicrobiae bacterium]|nr:lamin tail domain-containing protein [Verrucomicrobiae bacterium]
MNVATILINGVAYPVTWTSVTGFKIAVPLIPGSNLLSVVGVDTHGQPVTGASNVVSVVYSGASASPIGQVVINEILYNPIAPGAEFVELYNNSGTTTFDLSGWRFNGLSYTFPSGSLLGPKSYLVLAANGAAYAAAYGATTPLFDTFNGSLQNNGETLSLLQPGLTVSNDVVVAKVRYGSAAPWPLASVPGASLQLVDSQQNNWRVGNWAVSAAQPLATPGAANNVLRALAPFQSLWINELEAQNQTGITNRAGQHAAWLELYNPGSATVPLGGLYLANNYTNLTQWPFPQNASINPGEFKIIFADGNTNLSTTAELHTSFALSPTAGSLALSRLTNSQLQVLDYVDYTNLAPDLSYGSLPNGQSFDREMFLHATPGSSNGVALPTASFIAYTAPGSTYEQHFDSLPNPGATSVNSDNPVTINGITYSLPDPYDFAAPQVGVGSSGGLGLQTLSGWYGWGAAGSKFGATAGDQTTGGQLSFGLPSSANRALGLLATSSTGPTAFGARLLNQTTSTLTLISLAVKGELWRQSNLPKTLEFHYWVDPAGTNISLTNSTALVPALNVEFPTSASTVGGVATDGTNPANQTALSVTDLPITNWAPGTALWLVWTMQDPAGKAQGLGIDDLVFSASNQVLPVPVPIGFQISGSNVLLSWSSVSGRSYQVQYKDDLNSPAWLPLGGVIVGTGNPVTVTN